MKGNPRVRDNLINIQRLKSRFKKPLLKMLRSGPVDLSLLFEYFRCTSTENLLFFAEDAVVPDKFWSF